MTNDEGADMEYLDGRQIATQAETDDAEAAPPSIDLPPVRIVAQRAEESATVTTIEITDAAGGASEALNRALGTNQPRFANGLVAQIITHSIRRGQPDQPGFDFLLSAAAGVRPCDETEAMLAVQMATIHAATVKATARLARLLDDNAAPQLIEAADRTANRLARTYAAQVEALKKYRTKGVQRITVTHQHVNVGDGGQAVVAGNLSKGGKQGAS